ncbi:sensor histidine kinase [Clostridium aminobutyricum]|uniref:histidine kinase n=1 Tax=Clostridium aminobutyricum TaxID=33953 RepID=A0A939D9R7_CLOAM|nr:HAMP domain-containing sensor histidine kinase [Clostridium aminobutyricum]MBN7773836.1 HAMP domain-containing histidine kinase [Clostridium aminobutyricum]
MKMKNKILLSGFLMTLVSLIALLVISSFVIRSFSGKISDAAIPKLDRNVFAVEDIITNIDVNDSNWNEIARDLASDGYHLYVIHEGAVTFSNLDPPSKHFINSIQNVNWMETGRSCYVTGITVVGKETEGYRIIAVNSGAQTNGNGMHENQFEIVLNAFIVIGLISIATILLISQFFTNRLVKRIMRPISALTEGAKRIVQGNLSEPVIYDGKDELAPVCSTFNQMQSHLQKERERNAVYEKARTEMIAGISHDLRTPLTSVKGYIKGLRDGIVNTPEKQDQYLTIAYNKATEMDVLLQKLFYFSKLETGDLPLFLEDEDLGDFVRKFAMQSKDELAQVNAKIIVDSKSNENPVKIDTEQMHRVLVNLTDNALKYAAGDGLALTVSVWNEEGQVHLSFADNGKGVPEEQLANLFMQFWRGDESRSKKDGGGSGLGLNIVKYIVEAHGGSVSARNEKGLTVDLLLPARKEA